MWNENEFNNTFASPGPNKDIKKTQIRYVVPITGETLLRATQVENEVAVFEHGQMKFHQVCFVGVIRSVLKRANDMTYLIDDMTTDGPISVKLQADEGDDIENEGQMMQQHHGSSQFIENQYVRVFGIVKHIGGQKLLQAFKVFPVKELNEITNHMLECMNASTFYAEKASKGDGDTSMHATTSTTPGPLKTNTSNMNQESSGGLTPLQKQVQAIVKQQSRTSEQGVHVKEVCTFLKSTPESKIREALDFLSTEGHIYSTMDEHHFKSSDWFSLSFLQNSSQTLCICIKFFLSEIDNYFLNICTNLKKGYIFLNILKSLNQE